MLILITTFCADDARSVHVDITIIFAQMTARERHGPPESIKIQRISVRGFAENRLAAPSVPRWQADYAEPSSQKFHSRRTKTVHNPSLRFKMSLTACGLALPPEDFITLPTNHSIAFGLDFALATLSGSFTTI